MPIFEFQCRECGNQFEKLVRSIINPPNVTCESCGSPKVKKLVSTFACSGPKGFRSSSAKGSSCSSCSHSNCSSCK